jgi:hypothetical protein
MSTIDPESEALAALAVAILKEHPELYGKKIELEFRTLANGWTELWLGNERRLGAIPPEAKAAVAREIRLGRN